MLNSTTYHRAITFIQTCRVIKEEELDEWQYASILSITLICSIIIFFIPWISILLSGSYIGLILGACLTLLFEFQTTSGMINFISIIYGIIISFKKKK